MANGIDGQIHVEVGPIKVMGLGALHLRELGDRSILEPGELREGNEQFLGPQQEPEAVILRQFDVDVKAGFLTREAERTKAAFAEDGWAQGLLFPHSTFAVSSAWRSCARLVRCVAIRVPARWQDRAVHGRSPGPRSAGIQRHRRLNRESGAPGCTGFPYA